ncbi:MAG: hypothetical protein HKN21_01395 [Candidatus Eisenbacteria bacterium]|uniref:Uncharacterized protein n=1 Tax=Eiseniibacteriota bacterium TaxID=2212470 RepID=A0A7Y2H0X9_UNCEI|nr:hypothetical protein [Candidatus Eisenbacteria bacterium]
MTRLIQWTLRYAVAATLAGAFHLMVLEYRPGTLAADSARATIARTFPHASTLSRFAESGSRTLVTHRAKALVAEVAPEVEYVQTSIFLGRKENVSHVEFIWCVEFEVPDELEIPKNRHGFDCGGIKYGPDFHVWATATGEITVSMPYDLLTAERPPLCAGELLVVQQTGDESRE